MDNATSTTKTEVSVVHLNNKMTYRELPVYLDNMLLPHNKQPRYFAQFREHLIKTEAKLRTRKDILQSLCCATWGSSASTYRSSALGLLYPVADYSYYCAASMRIISGTIKSTTTIWLFTLHNKTSTNQPREYALVKNTGYCLFISFLLLIFVVYVILCYVLSVSHTLNKILFSLITL